LRRTLRPTLFPYTTLFRSMEALAGLKPVFQENGKITAGNASQMSDGASGVLLMSREKAEELGLQPKARIVARAVVGSDPTLMLTDRKSTRLNSSHVSSSYA